MNKRLFSIALILAATLGAVSWLKGGGTGTVSGSSPLCYPLGTLALLGLGAWGLVRLFSRHREGESDASDEDAAETFADSDDSEESDEDGGTDADEDA